MNLILQLTRRRITPRTKARAFVWISKRHDTSRVRLRCRLWPRWIKSRGGSRRRWNQRTHTTRTTRCERNSASSLIECDGLGKRPTSANDAIAAAGVNRNAGLAIVREWKAEQVIVKDADGGWHLVEPSVGGM